MRSFGCSGVCDINLSPMFIKGSPDLIRDAGIMHCTNMFLFVVALPKVVIFLQDIVYATCSVPHAVIVEDI